MANVTFGFVVFERCSHCREVRTHFSTDGAVAEEYREGACVWSAVENVQSLRFDLRCGSCGVVEPFADLMGLLYCTECMPECPVTQLQGKLLAEKTFVVVAFGDLPDAKSRPFLPGRLELLSEYFNQRRDVSRSTVKVVPFHLIPKIPMCRGEFIHDVGVLSLEPDEARKHLL